MVAMVISGTTDITTTGITSSVEPTSEISDCKFNIIYISY